MSEQHECQKEVVFLFYHSEHLKKTLDSCFQYLSDGEIHDFNTSFLPPTQCLLLASYDVSPATRVPKCSQTCRVVPTL